MSLLTKFGRAELFCPLIGGLFLEQVLQRLPTVPEERDIMAGVARDGLEKIVRMVVRMDQNGDDRIAVDLGRINHVISQFIVVEYTSDVSGLGGIHEIKMDAERFAQRMGFFRALHRRPGRNFAPHCLDDVGPVFRNTDMVPHGQPVQAACLPP